MKLIASIAATLLLYGVVACAEGPAQGFPQSASVPRNVTELWAGYPELDKATPLDVEVLKAWESEGVVCRLIRYQVGVFKGAPAKVAAFYAFPKGAQHVPALLQLHGGGQSASLDGAVADAKRGYASMSLNWGGNKLNFGRSKETRRNGTRRTISPVRLRPTSSRSTASSRRATATGLWC